MATQRAPGMDHPHYVWNPLPGRPRFSWPGGSPLALCVIIHLEHFEPANVVQHSEYSRREYGSRVGIFRIMDAMERAGVRGTAALDAHTAAAKPYLVDACRARNWEIIGHGLVGNKPISSAMSEDEERTYIVNTLELMQRHTGARPVGWLGPEHGESARTPALLAEYGLRYVCDWPNDEQPYSMTVPKGSLISLPMLYELDDVFSFEHRRITTWRWARAVEEAAATMMKDGKDSARLLILSIHPWVIGQPHRIRYFGDLLQRIVAAGAWPATGGEVAQAMSEHSC